MKRDRTRDSDGGEMADGPGAFGSPVKILHGGGRISYSTPEGVPVAEAWVTKDSGEREEFETGSRRDTREGKGRYDLLPPYAINRLAQVYERGAAKYGDRNWEKGQPLSRYLDSALRHTFQVLAGAEDEDHAGQAVWNLLAFMETKARVERGDLPADLKDLWGFK